MFHEKLTSTENVENILPHVHLQYNGRQFSTKTKFHCTADEHVEECFPRFWWKSTFHGTLFPTEKDGRLLSIFTWIPPYSTQGSYCVFFLLPYLSFFPLFSANYFCTHTCPNSGSNSQVVSRVSIGCVSLAVYDIFAVSCLSILPCPTKPTQCITQNVSYSLNFRTIDEEMCGKKRLCSFFYHFFCTAAAIYLA